MTVSVNDGCVDQAVVVGDGEPHLEGAVLDKRVRDGDSAADRAVAEVPGVARNGAVGIERAGGVESGGVAFGDRTRGPRDRGDRRLRVRLDGDLHVVGQQRQQVVAGQRLDRIDRRLVRLPGHVPDARLVRHVHRDHLEVAIVADVRESRVARHDHRDFPGRRRDDDLALVLHRALVAGHARDDVHLRCLHAREVAEVVLHDRPRALVQVGGLRNDVGEQIGERVVEAAGGAVERARQVAAVDAEAGERAGAGVVVGGERVNEAGSAGSNVKQSQRSSAPKCVASRS